MKNRKYLINIGSCSGQATVDIATRMFKGVSTIISNEKLAKLHSIPQVSVLSVLDQFCRFRDSIGVCELEENIIIDMSCNTKERISLCKFSLACSFPIYFFNFADLYDFEKNDFLEELRLSLRNQCTLELSKYLSIEDVRLDSLNSLNSLNSLCYKGRTASSSVLSSFFQRRLQLSHICLPIETIANNRNQNMYSIGSQTYLRNISCDYPLWDSHCHLQLDPIYSNVESIINRALIAGIEKFVVCGVSPGSDWNRVDEISGKCSPYVLPCYGLHPWYIDSFCREENIPLTLSANTVTSILRSKIVSSLYCGIGECGLDKCIADSVSLDIQIDVLFSHLELAREFKRPISLHCVKYWKELLDILSSFQGLEQIPTIVLHSCNSIAHDQLARAITMKNVYFSLNGRQLGKKTIQILPRLPLERILLESDAPDQLPEIIKSQFDHVNSNEPCYLLVVLGEISKHFNMNVNELANIFYNNSINAWSECHY